MLRIRILIDKWIIFFLIKKIPFLKIWQRITIFSEVEKYNFHQNPGGKIIRNERIRIHTSGHKKYARKKFLNGKLFLRNYVKGRASEKIKKTKNKNKNKLTLFSEGGGQ